MTLPLTPVTPGRFRLNAALPIAFEASGNMVDLLCAELRLAIELDGGQHLASAEAYRRDRRKDMLLQKQAFSCCASWPKASVCNSTP